MQNIMGYLARPAENAQIFVDVDNFILAPYKAVSHYSSRFKTNK